MHAPALKSFDEAVKEIKSLHGNMAVLSRLGPMLKDPNSDIDDAARLIRSDGALAASIIRISNSALYGRGEPVGSVDAALSKVGFNEGLRLVGMALSKQVFMRDLRVYGISADDYWRVSYLSGLFLEELAPRLGVDHDDAYLVGLLHLIGKVVLNELEDPAATEVYWDSTLPVEAWEDIMFGLHFDQAGAALLQAWNFPESIHLRVGQQLDTDAQQSDPILGAVAFMTEVFLLNHCDFELPHWRVPDEHVFYQQADTTPECASADLQSCRRQLGKIKRNIKGHD
jgi:HD-like signal output (HDOD) protein